MRTSCELNEVTWTSPPLPLKTRPPMAFIAPEASAALSTLDQVQRRLHVTVIQVAWAEELA